MKQPIFITGIGTGVGKTIVSAIVAEALKADYWKPVQAGFEDGTDAMTTAELISNDRTKVLPGVFKLALPASPHIAARNEGISISVLELKQAFENLETDNEFIVIEGAGGIMVPLNDNEFIIDLVRTLQAKVILVSRNYLGSINHSLLTAEICKSHNIDVAGWIFNDQFMDYEEEIVQWSGYPKIASIPLAENLSKDFVKEQAEGLAKILKTVLQ